MELKGEQRLGVERTLVWEMLNDVEVLKACVPGAEDFKEIGDSRYEVAMIAAIGPVRTRFKGEIEIADIDQPNAYTLRFHAQAGAAGFTRGHTRVMLLAVGPDETKLTYSGQAQVGGKLAQVGSRVIDAAAGAMTDRFFDAFASQLVARTATTDTPSPSRLGFWSLLKSFFIRLIGARRR